MPIVRPVVGVWGTPEATLATAINFANSRLESSLIESKRSSTGGNAVAWGHASGKSLHHKRESGKSGIRKDMFPCGHSGQSRVYTTRPTISRTFSQPIEGLIERIRFLVNSVIRSRLPHQWSSDNTIRIHTHEKQRVLIDHVGREVECCCRIGLQVGGEVVGLCTITAERQVPIQGNIEGLSAGRKLVKVRHPS